jgi:hypothetical protein
LPRINKAESPSLKNAFSKYSDCWMTAPEAGHVGQEPVPAGDGKGFTGQRTGHDRNVGTVVAVEQAGRAQRHQHAVDVAGRAKAEPPGDQQAGDGVTHPVREELEVRQMHERVGAADGLQDFVTQLAAFIEIAEAIVGLQRVDVGGIVLFEPGVERLVEHVVQCVGAWPSPPWPDPASR